MDEIKPEHLLNLLKYFSKNTYRTRENDVKAQDIMTQCLRLLSLDYSYSVISNNCGELSNSYPSQLVILEYEKVSDNTSLFTKSSDISHTPGTIYESFYDINKLKDMFSKARFARCRARFPMPVILYKGKHICRSATLSGGPEIYGRSGIDYFFSGNSESKSLWFNPDGEEEEEEIVVPQTQSEWQLFDRVRSQDIRLLKTLCVGTIVDLMVEKKKVKFGMNMTSSEKVDKENRYSEFNILCLPYPGCEFFRKYRDTGYTAEDLVFDWNQGFVDANLCVPVDNISSQLPIDWQNYKLWDLVKLTRNYLMLTLRYLQDSKSGLLVHCISGWDRTPLFVSLIRLSLWADGLIHQSLTAMQVLFLTIAYDWMLFGHDLEDRLAKGEEIFFFCFYFLKYMIDDDFVVSTRSKLKHMVRCSDSDTQLDGVLLDHESHLSIKGSDTSLNSSSSSVSSKSQDAPPVFFSTAQEALSEDHSNSNTHYNHQLTWPPGCPKNMEPSHFSMGLSPSHSHVIVNSVSCSHSSGSTATFCAHPCHTTPVAVPIPGKVRHRTDSSSSASIGSWQIITGTGSIRGSTSSQDSSNTPGSLHSRHSKSSTCEGTESTESSTTLTEEGSWSQSCCSGNINLRRERLEDVRRLFYNYYSSAIGYKFNNHGPESGLGSLIGNFAEKVGIRTSARTTNL